MNGNPILLNQRERRLLMVCLDLETTSADPSRAKVVQFGAVSRCPGWLSEPGVESCFLVDPGCPIPASATAINRITDDMVYGKETLAQRAPALLELMGKASQPGACVVGYNVRKYDLPLLQLQLAQMGFVAGTQPMTIDVLDLVSWYHRDMPSRKLAKVAEAFGVGFSVNSSGKVIHTATVPAYDQRELLGNAAEFSHENAHDALADVRCTFRVLGVIRQRLGIPDTHAGDLNLLRLAQIAAVRVDAEYGQFQHYVYRCRDLWDTERPVYRLGFGKHCGRLLSELREREPGYWSWLLKAVRPDVPVAAKAVIDAVGERGAN
jgi:DNA polymerase III epsilon subunit-like protein